MLLHPYSGFQTDYYIYKFKGKKIVFLRAHKFELTEKDYEGYQPSRDVTISLLVFKYNFKCKIV